MTTNHLKRISNSFFFFGLVWFGFFFFGRYLKGREEMELGLGIQTGEALCSFLRDFLNFFFPSLFPAITR